ncbi:MAG: acyltransferase family protein [Nitrospiraceae bacterium]|nr:acyltransferase family protein [Nitrospiraceae bacterium]
MTERAPSARIESIDLFRVIACLAIIAIHTQPFALGHFGYSAYSDNRFLSAGNLELIAVLINQGARFAVPFFFLAAGYFFGKKVLSGVAPWKLFAGYSKKLLLIFFFWSLVYMLLPAEPGALGRYGYVSLLRMKFEWAFSNPATFMLEGFKPHLWFLMSLITAFGILAALLSRGLAKAALPLSAALYVFGLLAGSYASTPIGIRVPFNTRNGPFFSTLFVAAGFHLASGKVKPKFLWAAALASAGVAIHMTEAFILWKSFGIDPSRLDYLAGTVPFAAGLMMMLLSKRDFGGKWQVRKLARFTLGIYVSQYIFIDIFTPLTTRFESVYWEMAFPFLVFFCSLLLVFFLSSNRFTRRIAA